MDAMGFDFPNEERPEILGSRKDHFVKSMHPLKAEQLMRKYGDALCRKRADEIARKLSDLPDSPHMILLAAKVMMGCLQERQMFDKKTQDMLLRGLVYLPCFVDDVVADGINSQDPSFANESDSYMALLAECAGGGYLGWSQNGFVKAIKELDRDDPLYGRKLRSVVGVNFPES